MGIGSVVKTVGKVIGKGGKWAWEHADQISDAVDTGNKIHSGISDIRERRKNAKDEREYYHLLESENEAMHEVLKEIQEGISELEEVFESSIKNVEKKYDDTYTEVEELKLDLTKEVTKLQTQLDQYNHENIAYQQKLHKKLELTNILAGIGIAIAIVIAILL